MWYWEITWIDSDGSEHVTFGKDGYPTRSLCERVFDTHQEYICEQLVGLFKVLDIQVVFRPELIGFDN